MKLRLLVFTLSFSTLQICAQRNSFDYSVIRPVDWVIQKNDSLDFELGDYAGAKAFFLKRKIENYKSASVAYRKDLNFRNGTIDCDIASPNGKAGFVGLAFHVQDSHHYEVIYFRPGSSGTINAVQYMPEKKSEFNWWDYESDKYQAKAILPATEWFHVKIIVENNNATVFVNQQTEPVMVRDDLDPCLQSGSVGFWLGNCASGTYKNLKVLKNQ